MIRGIALPMKRFNTATHWSKLVILPTSRIRHHSYSCSNSRTDRIFLSTSVKEEFSVRLALTDVHLQHEQLPFAYAFRATLDPDQLISLPSEVLCRYPVLGATVDFARSVQSSHSATLVIVGILFSFIVLLYSDYFLELRKVLFPDLNI